MVFIDTNVIIDLMDVGGTWHDWSLDHLTDALLHGPALINAIVFAELSASFQRLDRVESFVANLGLEIEPLPRDALFIAGQTFAQYRRAGGTKVNVLADFFVGAHAVVLGTPLLTRDVARYRTYFPGLELIAP